MNQYTYYTDTPDFPLAEQSLLRRGAGTAVGAAPELFTDDRGWVAKPNLASELDFGTDWTAIDETQAQAIIVAKAERAAIG